MKSSLVFVAIAGLSMCGMVFAGDMSSSNKMKKIDTDGDGKVSAAEHDAGAKMMFEKMDSDRDGFVTTAEMDAGHKQMMDHDKMGHDKMGQDKMGQDKMDDGMKKDPATQP